MYNYKSIAKRVESILPHAINVFLTTYYVLSELPEGMLSRQEERDTLVAALLHDMGKANWPENWYVDPKQKLERHTFTIMQKHPLIGASAARDAGLPESIAKTIQQHHEKPGGKGYPLKLEPSLPALILAACDVYAAATEDREYRKKPLSHQEAINVVAKFAPPEVVDILSKRVQREQTG
jgi:putative nucleotidyltransferase with HDIG domain